MASRLSYGSQGKVPVSRPLATTSSDLDVEFDENTGGDDFKVVVVAMKVDLPCGLRLPA